MYGANTTSLHLCSLGAFLQMFKRVDALRLTLQLRLWNVHAVGTLLSRYSAEVCSQFDSF